MSERPYLLSCIQRASGALNEVGPANDVDIEDHLNIARAALKEARKLCEDNMKPNKLNG